ncbi:hypothetical protein LguiA_019246 [Lonicera macranthoides]
MLNRCFHLFISAISISRCYSVLLAKALAVRIACLFCLRFGYRGAIIEFDCATVTKWCNALDEAPPWEIAMVMEDIHVRSSESSFVFVAMRRFVNCLTNWAAKLFRSSRG